ncbi:hypothetical protein [Vibrio algarum]|uniref:Uncharacterized protein n=1 Tax=Vibrio algarum TaxID=3020714 RepID=A0ABT4YSB2_9VIBR|nr:hypothetical protein [Vibrio sp. KJ40-1]MDB1124292.1 hypothetical protein [Vibrio sp. KJ40-1]
MEVRGKDLKFRIAGMSLLASPFIGGMAQKHENLTSEGMMVGVIVTCILLAINLSNRFLILLWKKHKKFKKHFLVSHGVVLISSFIIPPPYAYIIAGPLIFYIGDLFIRSLEEL